MSWETRGSRRRYTRSRRVAGKVVREYVGTGELAAQAAAADDAHRRQEQADRDARRVLDVDVEALDDLAELLAHAALLVAGYYRHDRGPWRKRRTPRAARTTPDPA
jgi:hypothetical protein